MERDGTSPRIRIDVSGGWSFVKRHLPARMLKRGECFTATVDLPHCWNVEDSFVPGVDYYRGYGVYRKAVRVPVSDLKPQARLWFLETEGFYGTGDVWLNATRLAKVDGQYLGLRLPLGETFDPNVANTLAIRLTNRCKKHVLPGITMPDFLLYGGLAGRAFLVGLPFVHFNERSTRIECRNVLDSQAEVSLECSVRNAGSDAAKCSVTWTIIDRDGVEIARERREEVEIAAGSHEKVCLQLSVPSPRLWSLDDPHLYRAVGVVRRGDECVDTVEESFGLRQAEFRQGQGFFLKCERVELRGVNRHESMLGYGNALPAEQHRKDAELIKSCGLNFVRLSHYPQHPEFLKACDELGILVYAEIATWKSVRRGLWLKSALRQLNDMVRRDRNHPSVIIWGMGNESRDRMAFERMREIIRQLDPTRPVTYAENHLYRARRKKTLGLPDVWGMNYELDVLEEGAASSRTGCVIVSECSNYPHAERGNIPEEARQVAIIENDLVRLKGREFVAGFCLWSFNDYATLRKQRYRRFSGIVDSKRTPKMSAALLKAMYSREPFLMAFADGTSEAEKIVIHIFTNCDKVTMLAKGREIISCDGKPHICATVDLIQGDMVVKGVYRDKVISVHIQPS